MNNEYIIEMKGITKTFPGVVALNNVNIKVRPGTIHAIVGENGAGKSTLMKILSGVHRPDEGEIIFEGKSVKFSNQKQALDMGISMIYQELNMVYDMNVAENIFLGNEPRNKMGFVDYKKMHKDAEQVLAELGLDYDTKTNVGELSVAAMQMAEIAKAVSRNVKVLVMDEPTSAIAEHEIKELFAFLEKLKAGGVTILYISHKLNELFEIADDATILRDGNYIGTKPMKEFSENEIITMMVGREVSSIYPKERIPLGETIIEVKNFTRSGVFENVSFAVRKGEIFGISGLLGSGRTELVRAIFGLDPHTSGEIYIEGKKVKIKQPSDAIKNGIALCPEDRKRMGLVLIRSIRENMSLPHLKTFSKKLFINKKEEKLTCDDLKEKLRIKIADMDNRVDSLSGGNQQKVVLAKWMMGSPKVFILDEPTRGIDVGAKHEIYLLMTELAKQGMAVIMISSELPEVMGMSDEIMIMSEGVQKGILNAREVDENTVMKLSIGGY